MALHETCGSKMYTITLEIQFIVSLRFNLL